MTESLGCAYFFFWWPSNVRIADGLNWNKRAFGLFIYFILFYFGGEANSVRKLANGSNGSSSSNLFSRNPHLSGKNA